MEGLQALDVSVFRFVNGTLSNPVFDVVMPFASGNPVFVPVLVAAAVLLIWRGRLRGLLCLVMLALILALGDGFICNTIKHAVARPRPFLDLPDARVLIGRGASGSLPSTHAANWFAAAMIAFIYYRRSVWFMLPAGLVVSFSRVYNGVHYPSDVLAGAVLGAGYAAAILLALNGLWQWAGRKWFPLWWKRLPNLLDPVLLPEVEEELVPPPRRPGGAARSKATTSSAPATIVAPHVELDAHWLHLGYVLIAVLLLARLAYVASDLIQLSEDEAYQWLWSKHLALSYYSKPPLIAYTQFLGTSLWGDTVFGVRFFSPVIAAILSFVVMRFMAREVNARVGFFLLLILTATPLAAAGTVLMTIDPLSVLFWTAAMVAGWRAVSQPAEQGAIRPWLWVGLWMGLGFLSKYTELLQWICWALFFVLWPPARKHLRRPGPYLALAVNVLCAVPVLIWNYQHDWVTVTHVADDAGLGQGKPLLKHLRDLGDFLGGEFALLNPVFFVATIWTSIVFWRRNRQNPRLVYFFSMGAPVFLAYLAQSLHSRVMMNWIAPAIVPLFCLMVTYWDTRWRLGVTLVKRWLALGLAVGFIAVILVHDTDLVGKITGHYLPVNQDPLHRLRVWDDVAAAAGEARKQLLAEGKPVFIITDHYGIAGIISFYLPEARTQTTGEPLVYCQSSAVPENQFYFWPGYNLRKGDNAIFARQLDRDDPKAGAPPARLASEFESVTPLGIRYVLYHGRLCRPLEIFACRGVR